MRQGVAIAPRPRRVCCARMGSGRGEKGVGRRARTRDACLLSAVVVSPLFCVAVGITSITRNQLTPSLPRQVEGDGEGLWTIMQEVLKGMGLETEHLGEKHAREM